MAEGSQPTIGVFWDINSCPVPDGMDVAVVRRSIISALEKCFGVPCRVIIFAVGVLDNVAPQIIKGICSSGIFIRHIMFGFSEYRKILDELLAMGKMEKLLFISGITVLNFPDGFPTVLRARPKSLDGVKHLVNYEWVWENLLTEYSRKKKTKGKRNRRPEVISESDLFCNVCKRLFSSKSCDDFIKHLKTDEDHKENTRDSVFTDDNDRPYLYCEACKYPGYDDYHMIIHLESSEHKDSLSKTCPHCKFCNFKGNDMAYHYNSEEHTWQEISFVLEDGCVRKSAAMEM